MAKIDSPSSPQLPPAEIRTVITLVLIVHLFAVTVALAAYTQPSPLLANLRDLLSPYNAALSFDVFHLYYGGSRWHLTHGAPTDVDYTVVVETKMHDGSVRTTTVPPPDVQPPIRRRRYQALANAIGSAAGNEQLEIILPRTVAGSLIKRADAKRGTVTVRAFTPGPQDVYTDEYLLRSPFNATASTVFAADVLVEGGQVDVVKKASALEVAPAQGGAAKK